MWDQIVGFLNGEAARVLESESLLTAVYVLVLIGVTMLLRLWMILPARVRQGKVPPTKGNKWVRQAPASTLVVFGSGGHTKEMITLLQSLSTERYRPLYFVRATTDHRSEGMVRTSEGTPTPAAFLTIPRSREVLQSWLTTPFTTVRASVSSFLLVFRLRPDVILCNGPGTCLPICVCALLLRFIGYSRTKIIFVESFCRVKTLSLTGKLLYYLADRFVVQWPGLQQRYKLVEYIGPIC